MHPTVDQHLSLVHAIARRVARQAPRFEHDELVSEGFFGLLDAIERFNPALGLAFSTFATPRIKGTMLDAIRRESGMGRFTLARRGEMYHADNFLRCAGIRPTPRRLAELLAVDVKLVDGWMLAGGQRAEHRSDRLLPTVVDPATRADERLAQESVVRVLQREIAALPVQQRRVLEGLYWNGETGVVVGESMGVTESRVCQIHAKARSRLRASLEKSHAA